MPDTLDTQNGTLRRKADDVVETGYDKAQGGLEKARSGAHEAIATTDHALESARDYITENAQTRPLATVGAALGAGVILGLLLRR